MLTTWARRALSIGLCTGLCAAAVIGFPVFISAAAVIDLLGGGRRWATVRCTMLATSYLLCELAGVAASLAVWLWYRISSLRGPKGEARDQFWTSKSYLAANFRLQCWWAAALFHSATFLFEMRAVVEGDEAVQQGPFVPFSRHVSIGDTLLPAIFVAARHGIMLRYIMKRQLLWDPCLDVVGNRLQNYFVQRGSGESARAIASMQRLMEHLGPRDGVLIYPEGTFFTPSERRRALMRLHGSVSPDLLARAASLRHVLPPRLGGPLGLLERNAGADAVFCAHTGFEGADTFGALLQGALIRQTIRIRFWRVPYAEIPADPTARAAWLYEQWTLIDDWIAAQRGERCFEHRPARDVPG
jgi:1-acyl-sn-glycerol-3-phosphate acyltransferase